MDNKKPTHKDFDLMIEAMANTVSETPEVAEEFLKEEGINVSEITNKGLLLIKKLQAKAKIELGKQKQGWFERKKQEFLNLLRTDPEWIKQSIDRHELQLNFRGLEKLDEEELKRLSEDANFLSYLEENFPDDEPPK